MNKLEALITDLDGSLLRDDKTIGAQDVITLQKLRDKGIPVFIATGRHQCICRTYAQQLQLGTPTVTSNGGLLYDFAAEEIVWMHAMPADAVADLLAFTTQRQLVHYYYTHDRCLLDGDPHSPTFQSDMALCNIARPGEVALIPPDFDPLAQPIIKYMVPDFFAPHMAALQQTDLGSRVTWAYSGYDFLDINAHGVSKGSAVRQLATEYGFALENTLAMGDNFNDLEMLQAVGYSVAPATAEADLRQHAKFTTCSNNDNPITHIINQLFPELLA